MLIVVITRYLQVSWNVNIGHDHQKLTWDSPEGLEETVLYQCLQRLRQRKSEATVTQDMMDDLSHQIGN